MTSLRSAHAAVEPMSWGPRVAIEEDCASIPGRIAEELP